MKQKIFKLQQWLTQLHVKPDSIFLVAGNYLITLRY